MSKKGFTLIELLAVIVIMGVLSTVIIISMNRYLRSSRNSSYETLEKTMFEGAENYVMDHLDLIDSGNSTISVNDLLSGGYIDELIDPRDNAKRCTGNVVVINNNSTGKMVNLSYQINLSCKGYTSENVVYPK